MAAWPDRAPPLPPGVVDSIEMSDVGADVAAVAAFLAADTTDVLAADTTDVLSAAKAASGGFCLATLCGFQVNQATIQSAPT